MGDRCWSCRHHRRELVKTTTQRPLCYRSECQLAQEPVVCCSWSSRHPDEEWITMAIEIINQYGEHREESIRLTETMDSFS